MSWRGHKKLSVVLAYVLLDYIAKAGHGKI